MHSPHPWQRRHLAVALLSLAVVATPAHAAADETENQPDPPAKRVAGVADRLSLANARLCEAMLGSRSGFSLRGKAVGRAETVPSREPRDGAVEARVAGHEGQQELEVTTPSGCPAKVTLIQDDAVNAWADGTGILLTTGLLARCKSENDLALVLGHEMAHNLLRHHQRLESKDGGASGLLPSSEAATQNLHEIEEAADRFAVSLAMAAGYDLTGVAAFMDGLLDPGIVDSATHPGPDRRLALLRDAIFEAQKDDHQPQSLVS